jgi:hypothetical protein
MAIEKKSPTRPIKIRRKQAKYYLKKIKKNSRKKLGPGPGKDHYRSIRRRLGNNKYNLPTLKRIAHARDLPNSRTQAGINDILSKKLFKGKKKQVRRQRVPAPNPNINSNTNNNSVGGNNINISGGFGGSGGNNGGGGGGPGPAPAAAPVGERVGTGNPDLTEAIRKRLDRLEKKDMGTQFDRGLDNLDRTIRDMMRDQGTQFNNLGQILRATQEAKGREKPAKRNPELDMIRAEIDKLGKSLPAMDSTLSSVNTRLGGLWDAVNKQGGKIKKLKQAPPTPPSGGDNSRTTNMLEKMWDKLNSMNPFPPPGGAAGALVTPTQDTSVRDAMADLVDVTRSQQASISQLANRPLPQPIYDAGKALDIRKPEMSISDYEAIRENLKQLLLTDIAAEKASLRGEVGVLKTQYDAQVADWARFRNEIERNQGLAAQPIPIPVGLTNDIESLRSNLKDHGEQLKAIQRRGRTQQVDANRGVSIIPQELLDDVDVLKNRFEMQETERNRLTSEQIMAKNRISELAKSVELLQQNKQNDIIPNINYDFSGDLAKQAKTFDEKLGEWKNENAKYISDIDSNIRQMFKDKIGGVTTRLDQVDTSTNDIRDMISKLQDIRTTIPISTDDRNKTSNAELQAMTSNLNRLQLKLKDLQDNQDTSIVGLKNKFTEDISGMRGEVLNELTRRLTPIAEQQTRLDKTFGTRVHDIDKRLEMSDKNNRESVNYLKNAIEHKSRPQLGDEEREQLRKVAQISQNIDSLIPLAQEQLTDFSRNLRQQLQDSLSETTNRSLMSVKQWQSEAQRDENFVPIIERVLKKKGVVSPGAIDEAIEEVLRKPRDEIIRLREKIDQQGIITSQLQPRLEKMIKERLVSVPNPEVIAPKISEQAVEEVFKTRPQILKNLAKEIGASNEFHMTLRPRVEGMIKEARPQSPIETNLGAKPKIPRINVSELSKGILNEPDFQDVLREKVKDTLNSDPEYTGMKTRSQTLREQSLEKAKEYANAIPMQDLEMMVNRITSSQLQEQMMPIREKEKELAIQLERLSQADIDKWGPKTVEQPRLDKTLSVSLERLSEADIAKWIKTNNPSMQPEQIENVMKSGLDFNQIIRDAFKNQNQTVSMNEIRARENEPTALNEVDNMLLKDYVSQINADKKYEKLKERLEAGVERRSTLRSSATATPPIVSQAQQLNKQLENRVAQELEIKPNVNDPYAEMAGALAKLDESMLRSKNFDDAPIAPSFEAARPPIHEKKLSGPDRMPRVKSLMSVPSVMTRSRAKRENLRSEFKEDAFNKGRDIKSEDEEDFKPISFDAPVKQDPDDQIAGGRRFYKPPKESSSMSSPFVEISNIKIPNITHYKMLQEAQPEMHYNQDPNISFKLMDDKSNGFLSRLFVKSFPGKIGGRMLTREEVDVDPAIYDNLNYKGWEKMNLTPVGEVLDNHVLHTRNLLRQIEPKRKSIQAFFEQADKIPGLVINADSDILSLRTKDNKLIPLGQHSSSVKDLFVSPAKAEHPLLYFWLDGIKNKQRGQEVVFRTPHWKNNKHIQYKKWV